MREPPLATIEAMAGCLPREDGEPRTARISINTLADMHEAMDIEEETIRRSQPPPPKGAKG
jgi:hypothetical protein